MVLGSGLAGTASPDLGLLVPSWTLGSVSPVVGFYGKVADLYKSGNSFLSVFSEFIIKELDNYWYEGSFGSLP